MYRVFEQAKLSWKSLTETTMKALLFRVHKKLSDKAVASITGATDLQDSEDQGLASRGRAAISSLRENLNTLTLLCELVSGISPKKGKAPVEPAALLSLYEDIVSAGTALCSVPLQVIFARLVSAHVDEDNLEEAAKTVAIGDSDPISHMASVGPNT